MDLELQFDALCLAYEQDHAPSIIEEYGRIISFNNDEDDDPSGFGPALPRQAYLRFCGTVHRQGHSKRSGSFAK